MRKSLLEAASVFTRLLRAHTIAYGAIHELVQASPSGGPVMVGYGGAYQCIDPWDRDTTLKGLLEKGIAAFVARANFRAWDESIWSGNVVFPFGTGQEIPDLKGSIGFNGVNYYTRFSIRLTLDKFPRIISAFDIPEGIEATPMGWQVYPLGFYQVLREVYGRFGKPIYITENGRADDDEARRRYLLTHLAQVHRAIQDGCDIRGYLLWSFIDNFEWREGFEKKFGIVAMDHTDPELTRRPRRSAWMYRDIIRSNAITQAILDEYSPGIRFD